MDRYAAIYEFFRIMEGDPWAGLAPETRERCMKRVMAWFDVLSDEERDLAVKLLETYSYIPHERYEREIGIIVKELRVIHPIDRPTVFTPIKRPGTEHIQKSGDLFGYAIQTHLATVYGRDVSQNYLWRQSVARLAPLPPNATAVVFVDDYIGSGETVEEVIRHYYTSFRSRGDRVIVMAIAVHKEGLRAINDVANHLGMPVDVIASHSRDKGIASNSGIVDKANAYGLVEALERKLGVPDDYRLGFGACEDLITLMRTPDNTLPMFWYEPTGVDFEWQAPFARN